MLLQEAKNHTSELEIVLNIEGKQKIKFKDQCMGNVSVKYRVTFSPKKNFIFF